MSDLIPRLDAAIDHDACPSLLRDVRAELVRLTQEHAGLCNSVDRLMAANERLRGLLREARYYAATDKYGPDESLLRRIDAALTGTAVQPEALTRAENAEAAFEGAREMNRMLLSDNERLRGLVRSLLEPLEDECSLDHTGNCQAHYIESPCRVAIARAALAGAADEVQK